MFKKVTPTKRDRFIAQFPHCDARVLHAPGECQFCDMHPDWQDLRLAWGIAFTGYEPEAGELQCPATLLRPVEKINKWNGNVARPNPSPGMLNSRYDDTFKDNIVTTSVDNEGRDHGDENDKKSPSSDTDGVPRKPFFGFGLLGIRTDTTKRTDKG